MAWRLQSRSWERTPRRHWKNTRTKEVNPKDPAHFLTLSFLTFLFSCILTFQRLPVSLLRRAINLLINVSVFVGVLLLLQLWSLVPMWLFYSVLTGWVAYFLTAVAIAFHHQRAYAIAFVLAILTLLVSLPQPEHYELVRAGVNLAAITFILGSILQVCIIVMIATYFLKRRLVQRELRN